MGVAEKEQVMGRCLPVVTAGISRDARTGHRNAAACARVNGALADPVTFGVREPAQRIVFQNETIRSEQLWFSDEATGRMASCG